MNEAQEIKWDKAIRSGEMTINDVRRARGQNPLPNGDVVLPNHLTTEKG